MNDSPVPWMIDRGRTRHDQQEAIHLATLRAARLERTWGPTRLLQHIRSLAVTTPTTAACVDAAGCTA